MLQRAGIPGFDPPNSTQDTKFQFWLHFKNLAFLSNNSKILKPNFELLM